MLEQFKNSIKYLIDIISYDDNSLVSSEGRKILDDPVGKKELFSIIESESNSKENNHSNTRTINLSNEDKIEIVL